MCQVKKYRLLKKKTKTQIIRFSSSNIKCYKTIEKTFLKMLNEQNFQLRLLIFSQTTAMKKNKDIFRHTKLKLFIVHRPPLKGLLLCQLGFSPPFLQQFSTSERSFLTLLPVSAMFGAPIVYSPLTVSLWSLSALPEFTTPPPFDLGLLIPMVQAPSNCHPLHLTPTKQAATHRLMAFLLSSSLEYALQAT